MGGENYRGGLSAGAVIVLCVVVCVFVCVGWFVRLDFCSSHNSQYLL